MLSDTPMVKTPDGDQAASLRLERTLELVYGVEGVVAARVWQWTGRVAIGIRGSTTTTGALLRRVESAVAGLREPGEIWEFGVLEDLAN